MRQASPHRRPASRTCADELRWIAVALPLAGDCSAGFGRNMIPIDEVSIAAPRDSDGWYLALMQHQFPGSFLPFGREQVIRAAEPYFGLVESSSGRLDYIETMGIRVERCWTWCRPMLPVKNCSTFGSLRYELSFSAASS